MSLVEVRRQRGSRSTAAPKILYETLKEWAKGIYTRDADRTPIDGLQVAENLKIDQDGTLTVRPGLKLYGTQPTGTVMGQVFEYVRLNTSVTPNTPETWNIWFENRGGVGYIITSKDGGAHTVVLGKTYTVTNAKPHFEQVYGYVLITTGVDNLSWMDVQTQTITAPTAVTQPTGVSATATGVSGSNITLRYRVSATNVGETAASVAVTVGVTKSRDQWNGTTEYVTFIWNRVSGAVRYNIYASDIAGSEFFLTSVTDVGSGATQSFVDTGIPETTTRIAPAGDSTSGMKATRATNVKGQPYLVGDSDNLGRIWFGGTGTSALDFSSYDGGGWVEPNKGGKDFPVRVMAFRDGKGTPMAACISKGTNGAGKRYLLQPSSTTIGTYVLSYMAVQEDNGADGTDSPDGVVFMNDALWYPSRGGFKTSRTQANIQNIISTSGISDNIKTAVASLSAQYMDSCVGLADTANQCIYWAVPYSSTTNNQIWMLDLRQKGAWMRPWNIAASWLWFYADNTDGKTKMLAVVNNGFYQFDDNTLTNDNSVTFQTTAASGDIQFGDNDEYANVLDVTFVFLRPQGNINLSVNATTEDGLVPLAETMSSSSSQAISGFGRFGWGISGWGNLATDILSVASSKVRKKYTIEVGEECKSISWGITTVDAGVSYQLTKIIIRYVPSGWKDEDN